MIKLRLESLSSLCLASVVSVLMLVSCSQMDAQDSRKVDVADPSAIETAVFAGGCFWCVESDFDKVDGVLETVSGYTGGTTKNPTYKQVSYENTGHYEAVQISYDPNVVSYAELVSYFFLHVDPTDAGGQFCDRGDSYRTAVFSKQGEQQDAALAAKTRLSELNKLPGPVVTPILPAADFWPAEDYHQDYYIKSPLRYKYYRRSCGRDARVKKVWAQAKDEFGK